MLEFSDDVVVGTIQIEKQITENDIDNIICSSFEGGSNYWMQLDNTTPEWKEKPKGEPLSTWATKLILEGKKVKVCDIEETEDDSKWIITLEKLLDGIKLNSVHRPFDADLENMDADTADCIVQYALFGKLVFG